MAHPSRISNQSEALGALQTPNLFTDPPSSSGPVGGDCIHEPQLARRFKARYPDRQNLAEAT